jgi:hypothetical protein
LRPQCNTRPAASLGVTTVVVVDVEVEPAGVLVDDDDGTDVVVAAPVVEDADGSVEVVVSVCAFAAGLNSAMSTVAVRATAPKRNDFIVVQLSTKER